MEEQKIKHDDFIHIGNNIKSIRIEKNIKQKELLRRLQYSGIQMTRECLVKIEGERQHIQASQLSGIRAALGTTYDELLK